MPKPDKHTRPKKRPTDVNQLAHYLGAQSTAEAPAEPPQPKPERSPISEYLAKIGRKGGLKGGKARSANLSARRRKDIAKKAAQARWKKRKSR